MSESVLHPTLYTPATTPFEKLLNLLNGGVPGVWRVVMCTEDSIREDEVPAAIATIRTVLRGMRTDSGVTAYVRVRTPDVLRRVLGLPEVEKLRGFVIPKAEPETFPLYVDQLTGSDFRVMPILESRFMVRSAFRESLCAMFMSSTYRGRIDCLRIGANDLMGYLGLRRANRAYTIYDTPVGVTIFEIINEFRGMGKFAITAPVFECYAPKFDGLLHREVSQHMLNGLFGQTVIHPRHIRPLRDHYKVAPEELESARNILREDAEAVAGVDGRMDEVTTHIEWARTIVERYELFGDNTTSLTLADAIA